MVSKWMYNGNMMQYVKTHKEVNRKSLVNLLTLRSSVKPF